MSATNVAVSAAVGAAVAVGVILAEHHLSKTETEAVKEKAHLLGWFEGRESVMQHFGQTVQPSDFTQSR